jgi:hypothetical protein
MEYKTILMTFPRMLEVPEENKLIAGFQNISAGIKKGLQTAMGFYGCSQVQKDQYQYLKDHMDEYVVLEKPEPTIYCLKIAVNDLNAFNLTLPGSREKAGDRLQKRMGLLIKEICRQIKIPYEQVRIEYGGDTP